jgi:hypothetical protein
VIINLIKNKIKKNSSRGNYLINGFSRELNAIHKLERFLNSFDTLITGYLSFEVLDEK